MLKTGDTKVSLLHEEGSEIFKMGLIGWHIINTQTCLSKVQMLTPAQWHELRWKSEYYKSLRGLKRLPFISLTLSSLLQAQSAHLWLNKSSSSNHLFLINSSLSPNHSVLSDFVLPCFSPLPNMTERERERDKTVKGRSTNSIHAVKQQKKHNTEKSFFSFWLLKLAKEVLGKIMHYKRRE